jgi:hypothetical protein
MENIFNILSDYNDLDTSLKKENYLADGFYREKKKFLGFLFRRPCKWNEISFTAVVDDLNSTRIYAFPLSDKEEKLEQMIIIRYHKIVFLGKIPIIKVFVNRFPIVKKNVVRQIRELNNSDVVKGVAVFEEMFPLISLKLKRLER